MKGVFCRRKQDARLIIATYDTSSITNYKQITNSRDLISGAPLLATQTMVAQFVKGQKTMNGFSVVPTDIF